MSRYVRQEKSLRKHPVASSSSSLIKAAVIPAHIKGRPEWKGPGFIKKAPRQPTRPTASSAASAPSVQDQHLPIELQQLLLNIFRTSFPVCQDYESLKPVLQEIRDALSQADYEKAFGKAEWLEAYAVRWSPNRALYYATVLLEMSERFGHLPWMRRLLRNQEEDEIRESGDFPKSSICTSVVCFGGGAAETIAFGAVLRHLRSCTAGKAASSYSQPDTITDTMDSLSLSTAATPSPILSVRLVDSTDWNPVISSLISGFTTPPTLSKYASVSAKANNASLLAPNVLNISFQQANILEASQEELSSMIGTEATLMTLFFTLDELHITSVAKTAAFLLKLTLAAPKDSLLLVIDKPEPSPEVTVEIDSEGREKKRYPMHYVLEMALSEKHSQRGKNDKLAWDKLFGDQNRLFKMEEGLKYPLSLESIRSQVHLFKRQ